MKLVIFDVDGTLVDSQADIIASMAGAFSALGLDTPGREAILSIVGLSLPQAMARLAPGTSAADQNALVEGYKHSYMRLRAEKGSAASSPLYPGVRPMLDALAAQDDLLMGIATGKSRRGLDTLIEGHALHGLFVTQQVADHHPSKPHPSMVETAMAEAGVGPQDTVMVGDTRFDMDMARAAGVRPIGVSWGYHAAAELTAAHVVIDRMQDLTATLNAIWGTQY